MPAVRPNQKPQLVQLLATGAGKGGLMVGDILVGVAGEPVAHQDDLFVRLSGDVVGKSIPIDILRGGKLEAIKVEIGER